MELEDHGAMNDQAIAVPSFARLETGDRAPEFVQRTSELPKFAYQNYAGRYIVLCFYGSAANPVGKSAIDAMLRHRAFFNDQRASFFGVSIDPEDETSGRVKDAKPGIRFMWDFDGTVSRLCGAAPENEAFGATTRYRRFWLVVDPTLHVLAIFPITPEDTEHKNVFAFLSGLPAPTAFAGLEIPAPVLILPNVFEPAFCRHLIDLYKADGGEESGVMRNNAGVLDRAMKSRRDYILTDADLIHKAQARIVRRVLPEIRRVFFMNITRMERYLVGCYAAEDGGHFTPHRDNTQPVTAHRRFALSINLNDDFEGGEVRFPEYSPRGYKARPGWAVVFPCNALHAVSRITNGSRYAFLPFVYDDEGAKIREAYLRSLQKADAPAPAEPAERKDIAPAEREGVVPA
jgi:peroxiredoxin/predicted 2-oxoglutarate/Fe(II)-dependent dioxygenase YbiX